MTDSERDKVFEIWAPEGGLWSPWVKPVVFAALTEVQGIPQEPAWMPDVSAVPFAPDTIYVVDLPGADGIRAGMNLASRGCRPVPLYNAVPGPSGALYDLWRPTSHLATVVDMEPILSGLLRATAELGSLGLPLDAPPAFLLDARRRGGGLVPSEGWFDNRSVSFVTDFPAATFFLARGYRKAVLIQGGADQPQADLAHTLRRWQEAGIALELFRPELDAGPQALEVEKPSGFRAWWQRVLMASGLRRSPLGGFGGLLPEHSSAG